MFTGTHQGQFDLVLNVFDVHGAPRGHAALKRRDHLFGELFHGFVDSAGRGGCSALYSKKRLGNGHRDFAVLEGDNRAVALDYPQLPRRCRCHAGGVG